MIFKSIIDESKNRMAEWLNKRLHPTDIIQFKAVRVKRFISYANVTPEIDHEETDRHDGDI